MLGTWAETAEQCAAKDKTNIVIEPAKYRDGGGDCAVRWIVETAGSDGINYAVHSLCTSASLPEKTQNKNIIQQTRRDSAAWPASRRNGGRLRLGTSGRIHVGICGRLRRNTHFKIDPKPPRGWEGQKSMFHNTLVVGSSPTSSTTQSHATGEFDVIPP